MDIFHRLSTACMLFCVILNFIPIKYIKKISIHVDVYGEYDSGDQNYIYTLGCFTTPYWPRPLAN